MGIIIEKGLQGEGPKSVHPVYKFHVPEYSTRRCRINEPLPQHLLWLCATCHPISGASLLGHWVYPHGIILLPLECFQLCSLGHKWWCVSFLLDTPVWVFFNHWSPLVCPPSVPNMWVMVVSVLLGMVFEFCSLIAEGQRAPGGQRARSTAPPHTGKMMV